MEQGAPAGSEWAEVADWSGRAARLGPLRYSDLGPRRLPRPGPVAALADWLAGSVDRWWAAAGRPDPFLLAVVSADDGSLARAVLGLGPECLTALRYVLVDPETDTPAGQARLRAAAGLVGLEEPAFLFPARVVRPPATDATPATGGGEEVDEDYEPGDRLPPARGVGPLVTHLSELPVVAELGGFGGGRPPGALVAVEVLSRLPYDVVELDPDGSWGEVRVATDLAEVVVPLEPGRVANLPTPIRGTVPGPARIRFPVLTGAARWLREVLSSTPAGVVAVVDRWSEQTVPSEPSRPSPPLTLDQIVRDRVPVVAGPYPLAGGLGVVEWRA